MVMEYVEGVKVTDQKSLKDMGISIKAVAHTVVDMFA
jgi:predicted unusual protein kinase regulating ubiquinone biosynthesis (AarF/ABC1/UbiB family)